jgi:hypothetical protein
MRQNRRGGGAGRCSPICSAPSGAGYAKKRGRAPWQRWPTPASGAERWLPAGAATAHLLPSDPAGRERGVKHRARREARARRGRCAVGRARSARALSPTPPPPNRPTGCGLRRNPSSAASEARPFRREHGREPASQHVCEAVRCAGGNPFCTAVFGALVGIFAPPNASSALAGTGPAGRIGPAKCGSLAVPEVRGSAAICARPSHGAAGHS